METGKDQRSYMRELLLDMELRLRQGSQEFRLLEVSLGGLALASTHAYEKGQQLRLEFLPFDDVLVEVRSCQKINDTEALSSWRYRIGVRFMEPEQGMTYYSHAMDLYMDTLEDLPDEALDDLLNA